METAKITHDHPDGIIGAMVIARAIYLMRSCDPFCDVLALNQALEMVGMFYGADWEHHLIPRGKFDETCQGCVPLAFHIIKESDSFEDAIRKAILYGARKGPFRCQSYDHRGRDELPAGRYAECY